MKPEFPDLKRVTACYFVGIGGIGMSALARYFQEMGYAVAGYDKTPSPLTRKMSDAEGFSITYTDAREEIPEAFRVPGSTLVVYTPAIPADNRILGYFREQGFRLCKRAEVLGFISRDKRTIGVAGTHGKTTVSTLTAFLMKHSRVGCNAFLGGISSNYGTNLFTDPRSDWAVIEADEFDRSFLHLTPELGVITAMDADHLDIYGTPDQLTEAFGQFADQVQGGLFLRRGLSLGNHRAPTGDYAAGEPALYRAERLRVEAGSYRFDYRSPGEDIPGLELRFPGRINVENAVAAITLALQAGVSAAEIREALPEFKGVVRRFEVHVRSDRQVYIDDYAHHPREIEALLTSVREMWPGEKLTVAFQPHLYSRTRDFYEGFARSLNLADEVILLDIYPARELPLPGVTSGLIADRLTVPCIRIHREELPGVVRDRVHGGVMMTAGAGDIDRFVPEITDILSEREL